MEVARTPFLLTFSNCVIFYSFSCSSWLALQPLLELLVPCSAPLVKAKMFQSSLNRGGVDVVKGFLPTVFEGTTDTVKSIRGRSALETSDRT